MFSLSLFYSVLSTDCRRWAVEAEIESYYLHGPLTLPSICCPVSAIQAVCYWITTASGL